MKLSDKVKNGRLIYEKIGQGEHIQEYEKVVKASGVAYINDIFMKFIREELRDSQDKSLYNAYERRVMENQILEIIRVHKELYGDFSPYLQKEAKKDD